MTRSSNAKRPPPPQPTTAADAPDPDAKERHALRSLVRWHAAAYAGPWTSDDPMVHDDGVSIVVEDPRDDALSIDGDAFSCDVVVELRSHGAVIELLDGTIEGRMLAGRPVATIATIRGPSERREACGGWDEGKVPREEEGP